jgi:hypothetical protein
MTCWVNVSHSSQLSKQASGMSIDVLGALPDVYPLL